MSELQSLNGNTRMLINRLKSAQSALSEIKRFYNNAEIYVYSYITDDLEIIVGQLTHQYKQKRAKILKERKDVQTTR